MFKSPPLEWIRAFEAAARCGSFTAAGADTGLTQSAISQRISHLEGMLGAALFIRRARSVALTVQGEAWLPHVRASLDGLRDSAEALFGSSRRGLTISASLSIIELWLLPRLRRLHSLARGQISVRTMVLGALDVPPDDAIHVRYGTGDWPQPRKLLLYPERMAPMASPELFGAFGNELHWSSWPRIALSGPRPGWNDWTMRFGTASTPVPVLRFDSMVSALGAARSGLGVVLGSLPLCEAELASGRLVRLGEDVLEHHESYWALAGNQASTAAQWEAFSAIMRTN